MRSIVLAIPLLLLCGQSPAADLYVGARGYTVARPVAVYHRHYQRPSTLLGQVVGNLTPEGPINPPPSTWKYDDNLNLPVRPGSYLDDDGNMRSVEDAGMTISNDGSAVVDDSPSSYGIEDSGSDDSSEY